MATRRRRSTRCAARSATCSGRSRTAPRRRPGPLTAISDHFRTASSLRSENAALQRGERRGCDAGCAPSRRTRTATPRSTTIGTFADERGYTIVKAQVIAIGPAQSFSRTVTIDAGTAKASSPDLTVINANGLVGRVIASRQHLGHGAAGHRPRLHRRRPPRHLDGAGFLDGTGEHRGGGPHPEPGGPHGGAEAVGDTVRTWGSRGDAPYLPGIPIGKVVGVQSIAGGADRDGDGPAVCRLRLARHRRRDHGARRQRRARLHAGSTVGTGGSQ